MKQEERIGKDGEIMGGTVEEKRKNTRLYFSYVGGPGSFWDYFVNPFLALLGGKGGLAAAASPYRILW